MDRHAFAQKIEVSNVPDGGVQVPERDLGALGELATRAGGKDPRARSVRVDAGGKHVRRMDRRALELVQRDRNRLVDDVAPRRHPIRASRPVRERPEAVRLEVPSLRVPIPIRIERHDDRAFRHRRQRRDEKLDGLLASKKKGDPPSIAVADQRTKAPSIRANRRAEFGSADGGRPLPTPAERFKRDAAVEQRLERGSQDRHALLPVDRKPWSCPEFRRGRSRAPRVFHRHGPSKRDGVERPGRLRASSRSCSRHG